MQQIFPNKQDQKNKTKKITTPYFWENNLFFPTFFFFSCDTQDIPLLLFVTIYFPICLKISTKRSVPTSWGMTSVTFKKTSTKYYSVTIVSLIHQRIFSNSPFPPGWGGRYGIMPYMNVSGFFQATFWREGRNNSK